ncbi:acid-activated periplasmic chaperone HdeA [Providencia vermicola]|uniref:Acid stress chaperone HdeA n=2 Tax=Providencia TaxID=586 RepID=A0AAI9MWT0_PROST|nr:MULTISPECIES: acid-activated periplasmic chaperone HdeA [Providencia]ELR5045440.1 acid-resistance protein [Providencia rettgeri]ELR5036249.1 acid-resistance protein [Providencia stuartii]ELR5122520.1 acid-resistance protein [Providencia stuartii]ELR5143785.1 acid-resistance protein [Providencia stuartii]ELR5292813.1 acid-resistance protein [Providencia stuartii]
MKKYFIVGIIAASLTSLSAMAEEKKNDTKPLNEWTCEEFLAIDDNFYPTAVGFGELLTKKDKVEDAVLDVDGIQTLTPLVIEACKKETKANFVEQVKNAKK